MYLWGKYGKFIRYRGAVDFETASGSATPAEKDRRTSTPYRNLDRHTQNKSSNYRDNRRAYTFDVILVVQSWVKKHIGYLALSFPCYCFLAARLESQSFHSWDRTHGQLTRHQHHQHPQHWASLIGPLG